MCTEDAILLQEVHFPPHVLGSCARPVRMANGSSVGMAELPSFVVLPHCDLTPQSVVPFLATSLKARLHS